MLLSRRLKEYRLAARISQKEMAERSGVGLTTICHLEQGVNKNITLNNFHLTPSRGRYGAASRRPLARTPHAPDGIEANK